VGDMERVVRALLRLGVYQLLWLDGVPPYAAISATLAAAKLAPRQRSFVNAVLRAVDRECRRVPKEQDRGGASARKRLVVHGRKVCFFSRDVFADPATEEVRHVAQVTSHPEALVARWVERFGRPTAQELLERNNEVPPLTARANVRKGTREEIVQRLQEDGVRCRPGIGPAAIRVEAPPSELLRARTFREGGCTVQDETAMKVAPAVAPEPGQDILDLCAAPGGKATHLAELAGDAARVFAVDRDGARLERLRESLLRLGLRSVAVVEMDAAAGGPLPEGLPRVFDAVLLDAPCSNTGVLGRRPEARWRFDPGHLASLVELQARLLKAAADWTRPGGRLVYSTCSMEPEENLGQVTALLGRGAPFTLEGTEETVGSRDGDGGFYAVLRCAGRRPA